MTEGFIVIFITVAGIEEARKLARVLVDQRQVACANIVPTVKSLFRWQDKVEEEEEALMVLKTRASLFPEIVAQVKKQHSYEVPEIIALPIAAGNPDYLDWIDETTR